MIKHTKTVDIGEVASRSGMPPSTLRYYEEIGLIHSVGRHGLRRLYDQRVFERLDFIALGQRAGFPLEDISRMFTTDGGYNVDREQLVAKADDLDQRIKELSAIRDLLRHAAKCPETHHSDCSKFQQLLRLAGRTHAKFRKK